MKTAFLFRCLLLATMANAQTGKVGIGTTSPQAQLHTTGSVRFDTLQGAGNRIVYADENGRLYTPYLQNINTTPMAIPDRNCTGISSSITITNMPLNISDSNIRVRINITHTYDDELFVYLVSPTGQILNLAYQNGGSGDNYTNTIFGDDAIQSLGTSGAPYTNFYKPTGSIGFDPCSGTVSTVSSFGAFGGGVIVPNGTWTLKAIDYFFIGGNTGILNNWSISFDNTNPPLSSTLGFTANYIPKGSNIGSLINSDIYDNGNLGIGTANPTQKLDVAGNVKANSFFGDGSTLSNVVTTAGNQIITGTKIFPDFLIANYIGIGTTTPTQKIDVLGNVKAISFFGDGSTLSNVVTTTGNQTITGTKIFPDLLVATNLGIGTVTPTQKLDVVGNVNATGHTTPQTGSANMAAAAYGNVFSNATNSINNSSNNCTLSHPAAGQYVITFTGANLSAINVGTLSVTTTLFGSTPGFVTFTNGGSNGVLNIYTFSSSGAATDRGFSFAVYKP